MHYIDDPELAYVMQRYRECHDLYHCVNDMPTDMLGELAVKYFEFANLGLPMAAFSAIAAPIRLSPKRRQKLFSTYVPWALKCGANAQSLITVYWEERWEQPYEDVRKELGLLVAPPMKYPKQRMMEAAAAAAVSQA